VKRLVTHAAAIWALALVILLVHIAPGSTHGWEYRRHTGHHTHVAYVEAVPDYGACRIGWWQTLRYGHVRPIWGSWCR
jgi:hypothetical protein